MANIFHVERAANKITLGTTDTTVCFGGHTASKILALNASKNLEVVTIGTGLNYTRPTLSLSHLGIEALADPGADKILFWDDTASACKWLGMGNSVAITDVTLDTIQDIRTTANPEFADLNLTGTLTVDTINEHTGAAGVTIEGILIKDSDIHLTDYDAVFFGDAQDAYIYFDTTRLLINSISEVWIGVTYNKPLVAGNLFSNGNMNIGSNAMRHTWKDYYDVLEIGGTGALYCNTTAIASMQVGMAQNAYFDDTDTQWEYAVNDEASLYAQVHGQHIFYVNAGAGAAAGGAITWATALTIDDAANAAFTGSISSGTLTFSTVGPTDNVDVTGVNTLLVDTSSNSVTIGGFAGGVDGQVLYVTRTSNINNVVIEHNEAEATQPILLHAGADETLGTEYGGWVFICHGGIDWHDCSHAKHVV